MAKRAWSYQTRFILTLQEAHNDLCSRNTCFGKDEASLGCCFLMLFPATFRGSPLSWVHFLQCLGKKKKKLCYCERNAWTYKPMIGMTCRKLIAAAKKGNPLKYNSAVHNTNNWSISNWNLQLLWALPGQDICKDRWNHSYLGRSCGDLELWRDDWGIIVMLEEALRGQLLFHHQPCL